MVKKAKDKMPPSWVKNPQAWFVQQKVLENRDKGRMPVKRKLSKPNGQ